MIKAVLFDLDGTMLPMDLDLFMKKYFSELCKRFCPELKISSEELIRALWKATGDMIANDRTEPNETVFWREFANVCGEGVLGYKAAFDDFYLNEFNLCREACGFNPAAAKTIELLMSKGYTTIAATNPVFPAAAVHARMIWAGVSMDDFSLVTTYENSSSCKPNPQYFTEITDKMNIAPDACLMVGNDVDEDMIAASSVGMDVFLVKDCMINRSDRDITPFKQGSFEDFFKYAQAMPELK